MHVNRFRRVCVYCLYLHGMAFVLDAFHVLIECPLYEKERAHMCIAISDHVMLSEFGQLDNTWDLCVSLLCPTKASLASTVGSFLASSLAKRAFFEEAIEPLGNVYTCVSKWATTDTAKLRVMQMDVRTVVSKLATHGVSNWVPSPALSTWMHNLVLDASGSKPVAEWLPADWRDRLGTIHDHVRCDIDRDALPRQRSRPGTIIGIRAPLTLRVMQ